MLARDCHEERKRQNAQTPAALRRDASMVPKIIMLFLLTILLALFLGRLTEVITKRYRQRKNYGGPKGAR
jgi:hypothetical protein